MKFIQTVYNFLVGDIVILVGILLTFALLALINSVNLLASLRVASGAILIVAILGTLIATLTREIRAKR